MAFVHLGQEPIGEAATAAEPQYAVRGVAHRADVAQREGGERLFRHRQPDGRGERPAAQHGVVECCGHGVEVAAGDGEEESGVPFVLVTVVEGAVQGGVRVRGERSRVAREGGHPGRERQGVEVGADPFGGQRLGRSGMGHQRSPWDREASFRIIMRTILAAF
ncbi:hypothetical protein ACFWBX_10865 [Streptomyces sp. NPDC059991]|uniref:hypothetical protein n=1 Tax=Streptomyces sp. NPDC059991 TaxID=3347028 RepID=UPI003673BDBC